MDQNNIDVKDNLHKKDYKSTIKGFLILLFFLSSIVIYLIDLSTSKTSYTGESISNYEVSVGLIEIESEINYQKAKAICEKISNFTKNRAIKGLLIRINSPGGTVGATQEIYQQIMSFKQPFNGLRRPVVASMGDLAASGGFYVACACDDIVANSSTLTGSIGVIIQKFNISELMTKLGVKDETIKSGEFKDLMSFTREITEPEKQLVKALIDDTYQEFFKVVLTARRGKKGLNEEILRKVADGRIFTGNQALNLGLIDYLGSFETSVFILKKKLNVVGEINFIKEKENPLKSIFGMVNEGNIFSKLIKSNNILEKGLSDYIENYNPVKYMIDMNKF